MRRLYNPSKKFIRNVAVPLYVRLPHCGGPGVDKTLPKEEDLGLWATIRGEFMNLLRYVGYDLSKTAARTGQDLKNYGDAVFGRDGTPEERATHEKKRKVYETVLAQQRFANEARRREKVRHMSWSQYARHLTSQLRETVSTKQGVAALLQHCLAAHAAEVAVETGVDVRSVNVVLEKAKQSTEAVEGAHNAASVGSEDTYVAYIDAPNVSDEKVAEFVERLSNACPAARTMQAEMQWRRAPEPGIEQDLRGNVSYRRESTWDEDFDLNLNEALQEVKSQNKKNINRKDSSKEK